MSAPLMSALPQPTFHPPPLLKSKPCLLASLSAQALCLLAEVPASNKIQHIEPATGFAYPPVLAGNELAGLGVRAKRVLGIKNINVYAVGIYVNRDNAKNVLQPRYGKQKAAASKQKFYDDVVKAENVGKSLRLVIAYGGLTRTQFLNALEERLAPPLKSAGDFTTLEAFRRQFDDLKFERGTEVVFTASGKELHTMVNNCNKGTLASPTLNNALLQVYLGPDTVAPEAKTTFGAALEAWLRPL